MLFLSRLTLLLSLLFLLTFLVALDEEIGEGREITRYFSPILRTELLEFQDNQLTFRLSYAGILRNSEKVYKKELVFERDTDYLIDYEAGLIIFQEHLLTEDWVEIEYSIIPPEIAKRFFYFTSSEQSDSLKVKTPVRDPLRLGFSDTNLNISGSKTFSVSVASDEDFSIHQSLFLRLDGELRKNLRIQAQLSDSQSPLTPEGDTRELSSLDQIYIKLYGNEYEVAFGDLDISFEDTKFINYSGRFEGLKGEWYGRNRFQGALAISKGKQTSNEFRGKDGKQGPYFLTVTDIGTTVQIIPGSEAVYLNGSILNRGTDYTIDYAVGSISFTSVHFIDSNSLIYIRFQYSDQDYRQNMYFTGSEIILLENLSLSHHIIIQHDDKNNPLQELFTAEDKQILKEAGDSPAWVDGVIEVEEGEGLYEKVVEGEVAYYRFVDSEGGGNYIIHFSYVGEGEGDYRQLTPNSFEYAGINNGSWLPVRFLPAPEAKANYDLGLKWEGEFYEVRGEGIYTNYDRNTFSPLDSSDNEGYGMHWQIRLYPDFTRIEPNWLLYYRHLSRYLETFADIREPELGYDHYEISEVDSLASREIGSDISFNIEDVFRPNLRLTRKTAEDKYTMDNLVFNSALSQKLIFPALNYRYSYTNQAFEGAQEDRELKVKNNRFSSSYTLRNVVLTGIYRYRTFRDTYYTEEDLFSENGTRYRQQEVSVGTYQTERAAGTLYIRQELNDILDSGWQAFRKAVTIGGETYIDIAGQRVRGSYSQREVIYQPEGNREKYDMAELNLNNSLLNRGINLYSNYSLKNLEFYPYVRELIFVGANAGVYDSTGVVSEDGEYDYISVQVGDPEMSIEITADMMFNLTPRLFIKSDDNNHSDDLFSLTKRWLSRIQSETYMQVMENSRSGKKWDVYLLKSSQLMNDETTIYGRNIFRQTAWFDLVRGRILSKISYQKDKVLDNRFQDSNKTDIAVRELMLRFSRFWATDFELIYENRSEQESRYDSHIESNSYSLEMRNRYGNNLQIGSLLRYSKETGDRSVGGVSYELKSVGITETVSYFFQRRYRLFSRFEYRRNRRKGSGFLAFLPDKREGNIFRWSTRLNYQINPFTSGGLEYSGNKYPLQDTVHQMKLEVRAEF
jgi:hypothetical protein